MEYSIRRLEPSNLIDLQSIYYAVYGISPSMDDLIRIYDTSIFGKFTIGFIAYDKNNSPAAYYGVFPIKMSINERVVLGAQSGATMTSPLHQKKGLFVRLAEQTFQTAFNEGIAIIFGFPNENSYPAFVKKLNWNFQGTMKTFEFRTSKIPLCELATKSRVIDKFYNRFVDGVFQKIGLNSTSDFLQIFGNAARSVLFSDEFVAYKYRRTINRAVELNGFKIFISVSTHLFIGEVERFPANRVEDFIRTINQLGGKLYCRRTIITISESHWLYDLLSSRLDSKDSLPIGYIMPQGLVLEYPLVFSVADYDTF